VSIAGSTLGTQDPHLANRETSSRIGAFCLSLPPRATEDVRVWGGGLFF
jgi:hypothetical protein